MPNVVLPGSLRVALAGARRVAEADPAERLEVSVLIRCQNADELQTRIAALSQNRPAGNCLSREEFALRHGAAEADLSAVRAFAAAHGLTVVQEHAPRRTVVLSGTVAQFSAAFGVRLQQMQHAAGSYRGRIGGIEIPKDLQGIIEAVLGLDSRPQASPHFRLRPATSHSPSFTPPQVAALYGFPAGSGEGQCVALVELGGGFRAVDLNAYFKGLGLASPAVVAVAVDHAKNTPGSADGPDGEVMLDIEVVGSIASMANIAVYFAPNTDAGFLDAITTAIHDSARKPSVISISWGGPESSWTSQAMNAIDAAFQAAAAMGITVCVASGDSGSSDGVNDGADHVDFPASSAFALACGGTSLKATKNAIESEMVWNDGANGGASGGGLSAVFALPAWQAGISALRSSGTKAALTMRGVPDVSGDADPETGYAVRIDGTDTVIGGTSAVAPLWAALIARINQTSAHPVGYLNPRLYAKPTALRDISSGNNGDFAASPGWDACTGLGSPNGAALGSYLK